MSELSKRIFMGIVMAVIVIFAIIELPQLYFYIAIALVLLIVGFEWVRLITVNKTVIFIYCLVLVAAFAGLHFLQAWHYFPITCVAVDLVACLIGIIQLFVFANKPNAAFVQNKPLRLLLSFIILISAQYFLADLRWHGNFWIVYVIALVAMFDSGAYFIGRALGKRPLAAKLSPKKTWGGFMGGLVFGLILSAIIVGIMQSSMPITLGIWLLMVVMTALMAIIAVFGDLFESMQKRIANKKDSSTIIPGHGGFFDRLDALLFVLPVMFVYRELFVFLVNRNFIETTLQLLQHK